MKVVKESIKSTKGNLVVAIHYPDIKTEKLAVLCSGYLDSKDYAGLVGLASELAERGYTVVRFDTTGIWESDGDIADYTTTQHLEDVKNVIDYMLEQSHYTYILLGGHSRGGRVALLYTAGDSRISCVLGVMPSHGQLGSERDKGWREAGEDTSTRDLPNNRTERIKYNIPYSYVEDSNKHDTLEAVKKITVPLIFIAGELDEIVLPEDVKELFNNANNPKTFTIIPGIDHDYRLDDEKVKKVNEYIMKELQKLNCLNNSE